MSFAQILYQSCFYQLIKNILIIVISIIPIIKNFFNPLLLFNSKGNILFAGGKDGTVKCYLLDASLNGQWFLNFQIEEENIMLEEENNAHPEGENNPENQEDGKDGNNTDNQDSEKEDDENNADNQDSEKEDDENNTDNQGNTDYSFQEPPNSVDNSSDAEDTHYYPQRFSNSKTVHKLFILPDGKIVGLIKNGDIFRLVKVPTITFPIGHFK